VIAEILAVGDELCRGEIVDTNSQTLAAELWDLGITVAWMTSCRDDRDDLARALRDATARADLVLCSGGLGPTEDDFTVEVIAQVAGVGVVTDDPSLERMKALFARMSFSLTPNNLRQVRLPEGARSLGNPSGIAPGFELRLGSATLFAGPGVPRELFAIYHDAIAPRLAELLGQSPHTAQIARRIYRVFGMGESHIDHKLTGLVAGPPGETVHYQVTMPETLVKLVVRDPDGQKARQRLEVLDAELKARLGEAVYGEGQDSLAAVLGRALQRRQATVSVAESCTGGLLGALITEVPGASDYFLGGFLTYSNEQKQRALGVSPETLEKHGAVSQACVEEMARGARERCGTTYALAISGVAGPGGGSPEKPVGTVHIAVAGPSGALCHKTYAWAGTRDVVRKLACYWAMAMLLREVRA
jgi:nicotinamide-nucleotide amidase